MKSLVLSAALLFCYVESRANPYFYVPMVTKGSQIYASQGALFTPDFSQQQAFVDVAVIYHPLSSGSIIPQPLQVYLPPESWSINLGGGYAGNGNAVAGPGISVNLLDSVRAYASNLLIASGNARLSLLGNQIAPGNGPVSLTVGPQWTANIEKNGVIGPLNSLRLRPGWFVGASYGF